ncbi:hypothetical protein [uncultured Chitinophaga sp.]|uniref:hypothetical protein n=1 Tax=uncultured Chitinophaga sp. TaxID=339340 RepID=UPI0025D1E0B6|nr:hypothetical protein [uncultured Chitinophaga sp.]
MPWDVIVKIISNLIYIAAIIGIVYFTLRIFRTAPEKPAAGMPKVVSRPLLNLFIECRYESSMVRGWKYKVAVVIYPVHTDSAEQMSDEYITAINSIELQGAAFDVSVIQEATPPLSAKGLKASWLVKPAEAGPASFRLMLDVNKMNAPAEVLKVLFSDIKVRRDYGAWLRKGIKGKTV